MAVKDWSTTAASNTGIISGMSLDGSVMTVNQTDNAFRDLAAQIASQLGKMGFEGADIASATTTDLANATGWSVDITGTTTITGFGTVDAGQIFILRFVAALTLTHNATSLILPGAANITTVANDVAIMKSEGSGNWRCIAYTRASGSITVADNALTITGSSDTTKKLQFQVDGLTTATTRTLTVPDADDTIVTLAATQTLTNKTLTSPSLADPTISSGLTASSVTRGIVELATDAEAQTGTDTTRVITPANLHAAVGSATAGLSAGAVGTYAFLRYAGVASQGDNVSGFNLAYTHAAGSAGGSSPAGVWQCMGRTADSNDETRATLWLRIS